MLKPEIIEINDLMAASDKVSTQPFIVKYLVVRYSGLLQALLYFEPRDTLEIRDQIDPFNKRELETIRSLNIRRLVVNGKESDELC